MSTLRIQLFGCIQVYDGNQPISTINKRGQLILAYLLLYRHQAHRRETLAVLLWPDTNDAQARTNLRKELMRLRTALGGIDLNRYVRDEHCILQWRNDAPTVVDVIRFEQLIELANRSARVGDEKGEVAAIEAAIQLYSADLMLNIYDEWVLRARQKLADQYIYALERIVVLLKKQNEPARAIHYARLLLQYDPLHELSYRQLMELYAQNGDHANVGRTYQSCISMLQRELAINPSPLTEQIYQKIVR